MNQITNLLLALITSGGLGLTNYIIAEQLGALDSTQQGTNREKTLSVIFTMFDLVLYMLLNISLGITLKGTPLGMCTAISTIIISIAVSFLFSRKINKMFYRLINKVRHDNHMTNRKSATNWQSSFENRGKMQRVYLYGFDHTPLGFGWRVGLSNDKESNYSISFQPAYDEGKQPSYEDITNQIQTDGVAQNYDVLQYVNFQQKFIVIIANAKN